MIESCYCNEAWNKTHPIDVDEQSRETGCDGGAIEAPLELDQQIFYTEVHGPVHLC